MCVTRSLNNLTHIENKKNKQKMAEIVLLFFGVVLVCVS